jgi:hypothetical protein
MIRARDAAAHRAAVADRLAVDEVELHAPQAHFEVDEVDGVDPAETMRPSGLTAL